MIFKSERYKIKVDFHDRNNHSYYDAGGHLVEGEYLLPNEKYARIKNGLVRICNQFAVFPLSNSHLDYSYHKSIEDALAQISILNGVVLKGGKISVVTASVSDRIPYETVQFKARLIGKIELIKYCHFIFNGHSQTVTLPVSEIKYKKHLLNKHQ